MKKMRVSMILKLTRPNLGYILSSGNYNLKEQKQIALKNHEIFNTDLKLCYTRKAFKSTEQKHKKTTIFKYFEQFGKALEIALHPKHITPKISFSQ